MLLQYYKLHNFNQFFCKFQILCQSSFTVIGFIPDHNFGCTILQSKVYTFASVGEWRAVVCFCLLLQAFSKISKQALLSEHTAKVYCEILEGHFLSR